MSNANSLPVNHHADHPGFAGVTGSLFAAAFLLVGRAHAKLAAELIPLSPDDHVVDVGCGPGNAIRTAARRGARATGVDPSRSMLRVARAITRDHDVRWVEGTAESLPVPDGSATVVWALATVHHWRDATQGLAEVHRVLSPGGRLLAVERQCQPGATGFASHGWTAEQVESFATLCRSAGLVDVTVTSRESGRRAVWAVMARRARG
ncbi:SAM-dependent methyltransferase [Mycolicibacterium cyprinidarum]|uniref:SAM-dependent methyltransferase n=1 Tax=Mycolicibacterium cyprinidarum TaxID=2860311 RepID=A0ABQ4VA22_9MYCO|nr:SAM-dependent methyltransferase [Mycolicibacterium sp. NGTWS1803]GJF11324.1 SAM-dependent methyltransferase [Mycolicibacterium sp. NGTWSNA01]GJF13637.1 SAM-dependent methyltransferase [Mycolicibacterium sp. NGTWS0302]